MVYTIALVDDSRMKWVNIDDDVVMEHILRSKKHTIILHNFPDGHEITNHYTRSTRSSFSQLNSKLRATDYDAYT